MITNLMKGTRQLLQICRSNIVKKKDLDKIEVNFKPDEGYLQKLKMYSAIFRHIGLQGFKSLKADILIYRNLRLKQTLNEQEKIKLMKIQHDIAKMGPIFMIQIMPFSGPLFLLYMYTYPESIPSWFIIDKYLYKSLKEKKKAQIEAAQYFTDLGIKKQDISLEKLTLSQTRKLSEVLFGYYRDGTKGYNRLSSKKLSYFIHEGLSKYMIRYKLRKIFDRDLKNQHILQKLSFQDRIKWKFQQVVTHKVYDIGTVIDQQFQQLQQFIKMEEQAQKQKKQSIKQSLKVKQQNKQNKP